MRSLFLLHKFTSDKNLPSAQDKRMQTTDKENYSKTQRRVLAVIVATILFCGVFALISNISVLKNFEIKNTFDKNSVEILENSPFDKFNLCTHQENDYVRIGGNPIGISIKSEGLIVVDKGSVQTQNGEVSPLKKSIISNGDVLLSVDGKNVKSIYMLKTLLSELKSSNVKIEFIHNNRHVFENVSCAKDKIDGQYKLGLALKEDVGGVGTLTFVTKDGNFAALGHQISDGIVKVDDLKEGNIFNASVNGVVKGERGKAGGLVADVNRLSKSVGEICDNTQIGIYGKYEGDFEGDLYRIAAKGEARIGKAQVLTTIEGAAPKFYDVEIVKVVSQSEPAEKGMVVKVSDKELIEKTGGIVQGMSGSPIVQDGVLIGAITHVFVQDPTRGYAVHSRFMFDKAQSTSCSLLDDIRDEIRVAA